MIPSFATCQQLMRQHQMLANIQAHSLVVGRITEFLVESLNESGLTLSMDLAVSAALLHDIGKTPCLGTNEDHAKKGREILERHGFHEIAGIVEEHVILRKAFPDQPLSATEIVYYADKRVNHDQIVSLEERLDYILTTYGLDDERRCRAIRKNFQRCQRIEEEIFHRLPCNPSDLKEKITARNGRVVDFFSSTPPTFSSL